MAFLSVVKLKICFCFGGYETKRVVRKNPSWRKRAKGQLLLHKLKTHDFRV